MIAARTMLVGSPQRSLALMTAAFGLGQVIGPVAAGYGFELTGSFYLPTLAAAAALCISAVLDGFLCPKVSLSPSGSERARSSRSLTSLE